MKSALWIAVVVCAASLLSAATEVDLAIVNASLYTVDAQKPTAEAVAIAGERIVAVGSTAEIKKLTGPRTRVIDARRPASGCAERYARPHITTAPAQIVLGSRRPRGRRYTRIIS